MTEDDALERYGETPLYFSHYYNFVFVFKSARTDEGHEVYLHLGGCMEKVSAMTVDAGEPVTLSEDMESGYAFIRDAGGEVVWKYGEPLT